MIVVFDTNIWYSQLGLKSPSAAAVRYYLHQQGAKVAIPEVVRLEVGRNLSKRLNEHIDSIRKDYRQLLTAFGQLREVALPTKTEVEARIEELFNSLGVEIIDVAFSIESARSSFLKTIEKQPPSMATQQFKDGVLWADCLGLMETDEVVLVTDDRAFYEEQKPGNGLAKNLLAEARERPHPIRVLSTLGELLDAVRAPIQLDSESLQRTYFARYGDGINSTLERTGFELRARTNVRLSRYATENPATLFIQFEMSFECVDATDQGRTDGVLTLSGDCVFDTATQEYKDIRSLGERLQFREADGAQAERRNHFLYADSIVMGHRMVTETTRFPLDEQ